MKNLYYLFAWSQYIDDNSKLGFHASYFGVLSDGTIFNCDDWATFYYTTRCYCEYSKQLFCDGFLTANKDVELFEHKSHSKPFYIDKNRVIFVNEEDITYYDIEPDNEAAYFRNHTAYVG